MRCASLSTPRSRRRATRTGTARTRCRRRAGRPCAARARSGTPQARRGAGPRARVAAYRVCFRPVNGSECFDSDILAAFDTAIDDGVHVISASVGGDATDYLNDAVAVGSLHAVKAGVTVVCSASNEGPDLGTVTNVAPWILTVAASSVDREFSAFAVFNHTRVEVRARFCTAYVRHTHLKPCIVTSHALCFVRA